MTGGAFGSMLAQFMHLTAAERRSLLVAGAAGGMSATFAAPISATLLAVELLLFEWKPRSLIPVALASAAAAAARRYLIGEGPLFPVPPHPLFIGATGLLGCVVIGVLAGGLSALLTASVYAAEDAFNKLPIHWMWWPPIGGLVVGIGGLFFPQALGVGYDTISQLLGQSVPGHILWGILLVKWIIWAVALGSGTSGGVLAPLLLIGGALGGVASHFLPYEGVGFWPLISMGAVLGGTMRSPFTGVIFALELTHDQNSLLPLLVAVIIAHCFTVLTMRRSILTEKISRRGYHLSREYTVDAMEVLFVRDVMPTNLLVFSPTVSINDLLAKMSPAERRGQRLFPVVDDENMVGVITRADVQEWAEAHSADAAKTPVSDIVRRDPVKAYPDESLTVVANRMAETALTQLPVVDRHNPGKFVSIVALTDLLKARARRLDEERRREQVLRVRFNFPIGPWRRKVESVVDTTPAGSEQHAGDIDRKWSQLPNPAQWRSANQSVGKDNTKLVCDNCGREFPLDLRCGVCGNPSFNLGKSNGIPAIICERCQQPQIHWDCPNCGRRQLLANALRYDRNRLKVA
jgi:CBS domain-containing protein